MQELSVPWAAWYENTKRELAFPEEWKVDLAPMADAPDISEVGIRTAFERPFGTPRLSELARGRKTAVIAVDDMTRPTQAYRFLPVVLEELAAGGIPDEGITIVMALGSHRPLIRQDLLKKLGEEAVRRVKVYNHCPFDNLVDLGTSSAGSPIMVNRFFMEAELKIAVGFILPHVDAGWGGGGKMIMPGLCGIETLASVHGSHEARSKPSMAVLEGNEMRAEIEEIARKAGLEFIVNSVGTSGGRTAGLFTGDPVEAHRAGVKLAERVYATEVPQGIEVGVFNSYPEDTEFGQCLKSLNIWADPQMDLVKKGGTIVITTAASEGHGCHYLMDEGMRQFTKIRHGSRWGRKLEGRHVVVYSPNISLSFVKSSFPEGTRSFSEWEPLVASLRERHGAGTRAVVFPCCCLQYLKR